MSVVGKTVASFPILTDQWHPTRNIPLAPNQISAGSNRKVWWRCTEGHEFLRSPNGRTNNQRKTGGVSPCPDCGGLRYWTWTRIVSVAREIAVKEGRLPPAAHFQATGHAMLVWCIYKHKKTWGDLREALSSFETSSFVQSRNGLRWRSHPEASLANFLFARRVPHGKGRKYPADYAAFAKKAYGYFDLWFRDKNGREIDVEIWGDKPNGHNPVKYAAVRSLKEAYNSGRADFLGIHYLDCYSDAKLEKILLRFIGNITPSNFPGPYDREIETSHWSNSDEVIKSCRQIAASQPDGKLPPEDWLRKRGRWAKRQGPAYNTLTAYIKTWIGGIRKARNILGQSHHSTAQWNRESALRELTTWLNRYKKTPGAVYAAARRGQLNLDPLEVRRGATIVAAVQKYYGSMIDACTEIGFKPNRRKLATRGARKVLGAD